MDAPNMHTNSDEVDAIMQTMPEDWRYRWCESKVCACMGCVGVGSRDVTKAEWHVWVSRQSDERKGE
jgi:hypothetical protein